MKNLIFITCFLVVLTGSSLSFGQDSTQVSPAVVPTSIDTLSPQITRGLELAKRKLNSIEVILKGGAKLGVSDTLKASSDTTRTVSDSLMTKSEEPTDLRTLIKQADSVLSILRLRIELLPRDDAFTITNKQQILNLQSVSQLYLVRSSDAHAPASKLQDDADDNLNLSLAIIDRRDSSSNGLDNKEIITLARNKYNEADTLLKQADQLILALDSTAVETGYVKTRQLQLSLLATDVRNITASAGMTSTVATRSLLDPNAPWTYDSKPALTTDPRINAVKVLLDGKLTENDDVYRTVQKDTMVCQFRVPDTWLGSEKYKGTVISFRSPNDKIIFTVNQSEAYVDSLRYWAAIYEASAYGKNQLLGQYVSLPAQRLQSIGADQSYLAKYHFRHREISAIFIQKNKQIVSAFIEYPNGSLSEIEADTINLLLNSVRFKESL